MAAFYYPEHRISIDRFLQGSCCMSETMKVLIKNTIGACAFVFLVSFNVANAKTYSAEATPQHNASVELNIDGHALNQRLCFFEDKAYSLGAIIDVEGYKLQCAIENEAELNGRLMWKNLVPVK